MTNEIHLYNSSGILSCRGDMVLKHGMSSTSGMSGSPIYVSYLNEKKEIEYKIIGIHLAGNSFCKVNEGIGFTQGLIEIV